MPDFYSRFWIIIIAAVPITLTAAEPDPLAIVRSTQTQRIVTIGAVYDSVVAVYGRSRYGGGSGVLIDDTGLALTNHHVVAALGGAGSAGLANGQLYPWKLVGTDPGGDIALIQLISAHPFRFAPLGASDRVQVGDSVMAMGNSFALAEDHKPSVSLGVVSGIDRYQFGTNRNMLVYGNCIQVDSSINPGNSGGPLFNMSGQVIGINGRATFQQRGRVNVGIGFAIPTKQIRRFLPDLMATKLCQHGTLDAVFRERDGQVICERINADSKVAKLGLSLGDRLIEFDEEPVISANQFTNLISTLPAGWPVELVFEHDGQRQARWLRLDPLPYRPPRSGGRKARPDRPSTPLAAQPKGSGPAMKPGKIMNPALNKAHCRRILRQWKSNTFRNQVQPVIAAQQDVLENDVKIGKQIVWYAADGRYRVLVLEDHADGQIATSRGWDGKTFWQESLHGNTIRVTGSNALRRSEVASQAAIGTFAKDNSHEAFETVELEGGDKADDQITYRMRVRDRTGNDILFWFSVFNAAGSFETRLIKVRAGDQADAKNRATVFSDFRRVGGVLIPHRRSVVEGLREAVVRTWLTTSVQVLDELGDGAFGPDTNTAPRAIKDSPGLAGALRPPDGPVSNGTPPRADLFDQAIHDAQLRTVRIYGAGVGHEAGYASGIIVTPDGLILTAHGIYISGKRIRVVLPDGPIHMASVVKRSDALQTVLLKIDAQTPNFFDLAQLGPPHQGDWVLTVANPFKIADGAEPLSIGIGVLAMRTELDAKRRTQDVPYDGDLLIIDAISNNPGSPGGAVVDIEGNLIGMIGKIMESTSTNTRLNYAVPLDRLKAFVTSGVAAETQHKDPVKRRATLGLRLFTLSGRRAPAYIDHVIPGSPADLSGLRKDDLIMAVDDRVVRNVRDYEQAASRLRPGQTVTLLIKRKSEILRVELLPEAVDEDE